MKLTVSDGNTKIGKVPNISFLPGVTCGADVPCRKDCYALKGCQTYSQVIPAWAGNTMLWRMRPEKFWSQLQDWFTSQKRQPEKFRWFVGGDIPDSIFLKDMNTFATANPKTKFLVFTKNVAAICDLLLMPETANAQAPNLSLYFSAWPGWKEPQTETLRRMGGSSRVVPTQGRAGPAHPERRLYLPRPLPAMRSMLGRQKGRRFPPALRCLRPSPAKAGGVFFSVAESPLFLVD